MALAQWQENRVRVAIARLSEMCDLSAIGADKWDGGTTARVDEGARLFIQSWVLDVLQPLLTPKSALSGDEYVARDVGNTERRARDAHARRFGSQAEGNPA